LYDKWQRKKGSPDEYDQFQPGPVSGSSCCLLERFARGLYRSSCEAGSLYRNNEI
jgi:hypothetical protein